MTLRCPEGMLLVEPDHRKYLEVEPFCMMETEVTQEEDQRFWAGRGQTDHFEDRRQPEGNFAGPRKPAVFRNWQDAKTYCQSVYQGGNLPTTEQWMVACGEGEFCTSAGIDWLRLEADYGRDWKDGPADVDLAFPNRNGIKGLTGGVWEWILDDAADGNRIIRGGGWSDSLCYLLSTYRDVVSPDYESSSLGYRCVAPPQE